MFFFCFELCFQQFSMMLFDFPEMGKGKGDALPAMAITRVCCVRTAIVVENLLNTRNFGIFPVTKRWISNNSVPALTEITIPIPLKATLKKVIAKQKHKEEEHRKAISRIGDRSTPIITSKRKILTHNKGQIYDKLQPLPLYTKGWASRKSNGDYFQIQAYGSNPALLDLSNCDDGTPKDFKSLGFSQEVLNGLQEMNITVPTNVQVSAIPKILQHENVICASETGSGKTLTYLAPMIHNILKYKSNPSAKIFTNSPLGLIIVPGRELALQIETVIKSLTKDILFRSKAIVGGSGIPENYLYNPPLSFMDIIVATPAALKKLVHGKIFSVKEVRHLVIDEMDTMMDDSFSDTLIKFMKRFEFEEIKSYDRGTQLCLVGATMPRDLAEILSPVIKIELMEKITTNHLHRIMPHVPQRFLKLKPSDKPIKLLELIKADFKKNKPVIIFSKNSRTCDYVTMFLKENGVDNVNLNADLPYTLRWGQFDKFQNGEVNVISCTDMGSRGLDTSRVQHVINYDFPSFVSDYIHRCGRTGRVGSKTTGHVTNFISKMYEVELVQKIETTIRSTQSLPNVNANITRKLIGNEIKRQTY